MLETGESVYIKRAKYVIFDRIWKWLQTKKSKGIPTMIYQTIFGREENEFCKPLQMSAGKFRYTFGLDMEGSNCQQFYSLVQHFWHSLLSKPKGKIPLGK